MKEFNYKNCPICNEKIIPFYHSKQSILCKNECYGYSNAFSSMPNSDISTLDYILINIFKDTLKVTSKDTIENDEVKEKINMLISYWKENDRYLMEIISNERI